MFVIRGILLVVAAIILVSVSGTSLFPYPRPCTNFGCYAHCLFEENNMEGGSCSGPTGAEYCICTGLVG